MSGEPYQVLGVGIPTMLGRRKIMAEILGRLTKPTPDHVQVVGPRHYGKSVILHHLATSATGSAKPHFDACIYWDLRHRTPASDKEFTQAFVQRLRETMCLIDKDLAEELDPDGSALDDLQLYFDMLAED